MGKLFGLMKSTTMGQLFSITDEYAQHKLGDTWEDDDGTIYQYWKNTSGAANVAGDGYLKVFGNINSDAAVVGLQAKQFNVDAGEYGNWGIAQAAIPDDYYGWYLIEGYTTNSQGKLFFGNSVNHTETDTTTVGEPLIMTDGKFTDATTWAGGAVGERLHMCVATEAVTTATSVHVYLPGYPILTAT